MASKPPVIAPKKLSGGTLNMRFMNKTKTVPPKAESIATTTTTPRKIHTTFEIATNTECYGKEVIDVIGRRSFQGFNPKVEEVVMAGWNQCKSDKRMRADIGGEAGQKTKSWHRSKLTNRLASLALAS